MTEPLRSASLDLVRALLFHEPVPSRFDGFFRDLGFVHLFSASGIHLLALFFWIELACKRGGMALGIPIRVVRPGIHVLFFSVCLLVWKIEGFHFSLFRPLFSVLIRMGVRATGFRTPILLPLFVVFLTECLLRIPEGLSHGAVHYYLAVGGSLLALSRPGGVRESGFRTHVRMAVFSWVPIALLDLFRDRLIVASTPVLNLVSITPISMGLYPVTLIAHALTGGTPEWLLSLWSLFLQAMIALAEVLPPPVTAGIRFFPIVLICGALVFRFRKRPILLVPLFLLLLASRAFTPEKNTQATVQLDVGQGDSALLIRPGRIELIDAGSLRVQSPDRWIRTLSRHGVSRVDGVLLTHLDEDHIGALPVLLALFPVGCIEIGEPHQREERGARILDWIAHTHPAIAVVSRGCIRNARVEWFESKRKGQKGNEWMAGIASASSGVLYLALGDGDAIQEKKFLAEFEPEIRAHTRRIFKIGHHGSRFSSDPEVLREINPAEFWISVGRKNRYRHPAPEVLERLERFAGRVRRTDREGDLVAESAK